MNAHQIEEKLKDRFVESDVVVMDLTGSGDHYEVRIASPEFKGLSRVKQHQAVMGVFSSELASGELHALAIKTLVKD